MTLAGKHALVTGGGSGIGSAIALGLAQAGATVTICGRRLEPLESSAARHTEETEGLSVYASRLWVAETAGSLALFPGRKMSRGLPPLIAMRHNFVPLPSCVA